MSWHRATVAIPLIPAALALAVRFHGLSDKPLWLDEIITQRRANLPISDLIANSLYNNQFPTYFVLVRAFDVPIIIEWMLRLPSAILGAISVLLVALIATEVRSRRAGLVAGIFMALSPLEVQFGQEARSYALVSCFVLLALWGLVRIAKQLSISVSPSSPPKGQFGSLAGCIESRYGCHRPALGAKTDGINSKLDTDAGHHSTHMASWIGRDLSGGSRRSLAKFPLVTTDHIGARVVGYLGRLPVSGIGHHHVRTPADICSGIRCGGCRIGGVGYMASQSQSNVAERHRFCCDRNADNDSGRIDILRDLGSPILDLEHGSVLRARGNRGGRSAAPTLSARCNGPCDWWDGESCAVLSIRNQAALGLGSRLSRCKCAAR